MYKVLAILNGSVIALMILSNGIMVTYLGNTPAVLLNHAIGLFFALLLFMGTEYKWKPLKGIPFFNLAAGLTGLYTVFMSNISFLAVGATLTLMLSMFGRILTSTVIDHFGLMGMKKYSFKPTKLIGLGFMVIGVILIVIF